MHRIWLTLAPELRRLPPAHRAAALRRARTTALDSLELVGMGVALVAVTMFTRQAMPDGVGGTRTAVLVLELLVAAPMLLLALGPFHIRRLRRGLRQQLEREAGR
jgi:uncharacterized membrane protein YidH (DUF202 family)